MKSLLRTLPDATSGYRNDIDGLRSVAVLSVIVFHLNEHWLPGGFVGVDIFFVISGYLITLQILREIQQGSFSISEFYRRRVKRIAPAMLAVLLVVLAISQSAFRPIDAERTAHAAFWSILSLANVYFWMGNDDSYFADPNEEQPLLHFWSLGVEEQFYLLWPLILILIGAGTRSRKFAIGMSIAALASFGLGEALYGRSPSFVYYMLPTRAGELLIGAAVAWWTFRYPRLALSADSSRNLGIVGAFAIGASFWLIDSQDVFPGFNALPATLATGALILAGIGNTTGVTAILSTRPMVVIGKLSYSAYLWHWPILAFARYAKIPITASVAAVVSVAIFFVAWLSYRYIETPFRRTTAPMRTVLLRQFIAPSACLLAVSAAAMKTDGLALHGFDDDYLLRLQNARMTLQPAYGLDFVCQRSRVMPIDLEDDRCVLGNHDAQVSAILWGDSNAAHYIGMMEVFAKASGFAFRNIEVGACPPLDGNPNALVPARRLDNCVRSAAVIWPRVLEYDTVIIGANWTDYARRSPAFWKDMAATVDRLTANGKRVVLLGKAPIMSAFDRRCFEKQARLTWLDCEIADQAIAQEVSDANRSLKAMASERPFVDYFDANDTLCPSGVCAARDHSGQIAYYDGHHLTHAGSTRLGEAIVAEGSVPAALNLGRLISRGGLQPHSPESSAGPQ